MQVKSARSSRLSAALPIAMGSDHAGFDLKRALAKSLRARGYTVLDCGAHSRRPDDDYPAFCIAAASAVAAGRAGWAIVLGGSGQGEQIAANKVRGIRAALCHDPHLAELARRHNDANILAMGARIVAPALAVEIIETWLKTAFEGGRHARRLAQIAAYEAARDAGTDATLAVPSPAGRVRAKGDRHA